MKADIKETFRRKMNKEVKKLHYYDVWNLDEVSIKKLCSGSDRKQFIKDVYLCFLKRYPTDQEYATVLDNLKHKRCKKSDVITMVQNFEEAKQYPKIQLVK